MPSAANQISQKSADSIRREATFPSKYNLATYGPSAFFKIELRLVAVDLVNSPGFGLESHVGVGLRSNSRIGGVENTKCRDHKHEKLLEEHRVFKVVDSRGLREFILVLEMMFCAG